MSSILPSYMLPQFNAPHHFYTSIRRIYKSWKCMSVVNKLLSTLFVEIQQQRECWLHQGTPSLFHKCICAQNLQLLLLFSSSSLPSPLLLLRSLQLLMHLPEFPQSNQASQNKLYKPFSNAVSGKDSLEHVHHPWESILFSVGLLIQVSS